MEPEEKTSFPTWGVVVAGVMFLGLLTYLILDQERDLPSNKAENGYKQAVASVFWIGEEASPDNGYIDNIDSAWDSNWQESYGGVDDPNNRCGYHPCNFTPQENPFYFALPYDDLVEGDNLKNSAREVPWYSERETDSSVVKNRWIEVRYRGKSCYAQWEDVGPFETDDFDYVFGNAHSPKNTLGVGAGIDVSPALRDCLGMQTNEVVEWRFVDNEEVPSGPWTEIITTSGVDRSGS